ncbi:hypothetical protein [Enterovirga sp. CN4-39]|uniref:hypothetical protein n=1 Tax=Enterovirga sp. CN4-39 TaxID=3400910 RepID=UPI003C0FCAAB
MATTVDLKLSDEAVEAGALAICNVSAGASLTEEEWLAGTRDAPGDAENFRRCARACLTASLPLVAYKPADSYLDGGVGEEIHPSPIGAGVDEEEIAKAIEEAMCPDREGPYGLYDYSSYGDRAPHHVRDFRDPSSPTWGHSIFISESRKEARAEYERLTRLHPARAVMALLSRAPAAGWKVARPEYGVLLADAHARQRGENPDGSPRRETILQDAGRGLKAVAEERIVVAQTISRFPFDHDERGGIVLGPVTCERLADAVLAAIRSRSLTAQATQTRGNDDER